MIDNLKASVLFMSEKYLLFAIRFTKEQNYAIWVTIIER